eukprot:4438007-Pyramimonas_sp.AAC.1
MKGPCWLFSVCYAGFVFQVIPPAGSTRTSATLSRPPAGARSSLPILSYLSPRINVLGLIEYDQLLFCCQRRTRGFS